MFDGGGLTLAGPVERVAEDNEADAGVAAGLRQHGELAGSIGVEGSGGGGLGGIVDGEAGPEAVGVVGHVQGVADEGEEDEGDGPESEDGGDGDGGVFLVGLDGSLGGDDGGDSADAGAYGEEGDEFGRQREGAAEVGHEGEGEGELDKDQDEGDAAEVEDIAEDEASAEKNDACLEPELVGCDAGAEDAGEADGVGDDDTDENGPEKVVYVGKDLVWGLALTSDGLLDELAGVADGGEKDNAGNEAEDAVLIGVVAVALQGQG